MIPVKLYLANGAICINNEILSISKLLVLNSPVVILKFTDAVLKCIQQELLNRELGYRARVNHQVDELFILTTRHLSRQRILSVIFRKLL